MTLSESQDDWRRQGQERFLMKKRMTFQKYHAFRDGWDHDHCAFCGDKLSTMVGDLNEGYATDDHYHWVCPTCFRDFETEFQWVSQEPGAADDGS
jgi:hypothetical protein